MLEAVFLMLPALTAVIYQELHCILVFLGSAVFCLAAGALLRGKKPENTTGYIMCFMEPSRRCLESVRRISS